MIHFPAAITTERLIIRPWRISDAPALWEAIDESREHLAVYMPWTVHYTNPGAANEYLSGALRAMPHGHELPLCLEERQTGRIVGASGYHSQEPTAEGWRALEIGYWLREGEEGKGYMRETVRAQTRLAFELGVEHVRIVCDTRNRASYRVAEACGYRREAVLRRDVRTHHGDLRDTRVYSMTRDESESVIAAWTGDTYELDWSHPPFERPPASPSTAVNAPDDRELPVVLTELIRLDPINLHDPGFHFTVIAPETRRHLGIATIVPGDPDVPSFGLKWSFRSPDEPIEFSIELGLALLKITFEELGAERVVMHVPPDATPLREVAEVLGFVNEGIVRAHKSPIEGTIGSFVVYSVIRADL